MQCLILAGGLGTRIRSMAGNTPKALLQLNADNTFIDIQLRWLKLMGVTDVVMALGHGGEEIQNYIEKKQIQKSYPQVNYSFDGDKLLGTGGAIRKAAPMLSQDFVVAYGDSFLFIDVRKLVETHRRGGQPLTFSIFKNQNTGDKSNVIFRNGKIEKYDKFHLSPEMEYIDYGLSIIEKDYFLKNTPQGSFDLADFLSQTVAKGSVTPFVAHEIFQEIGSPEGYRRFQKLLEDYKFDLKALAKEKVFELE